MTEAATTPVNSRLICSIAAWPVEISTNLVLLQLGQSEQPNPEPVNRTRDPVTTMAYRDPKATQTTKRNLCSDI
jgi:hypothetical protein